MDMKARRRHFWKKAGVLLVACLITISGMLPGLTAHGETPDDGAQGGAAAGSTVTFHAATNPTEVVKGKHYILAIQNPNTGRFYALAYDAENGNCREVDLTATRLEGAPDEVPYRDYTMEVPTEDLTSGNYVLTATQGFLSGKIKWKTNFTDENGKAIYLKMGQYRGDSEHLFDASAGGIDISQNSYSTFSVYHSTYADLQLYYGEDKTEMVHYWRYPVNQSVIILTDATEEDIKEEQNPGTSDPSLPETEISGVQAFQENSLLGFYSGTSLDFLMTFVDSNGKVQAITANGLKEVSAPDENRIIDTNVANAWKQTGRPTYQIEEPLVFACLDGMQRGGVYLDVNSSTLTSATQTEVKLLGGTTTEGSFEERPYLSDGNGKYMKWDETANAPTWVEDYHQATPLILYFLRPDLATESYHRVTDLASIRDWKKILITYTDADGNYQMLLPGYGMNLNSVSVATSGDTYPYYSATDGTLHVRYMNGMTVGDLKSDNSNKYKLTGLFWSAYNRALYPDGYPKNGSLTNQGGWKECMITYSDESGEFLIRGAKNWLVYDDEKALAATTDETKAGKFEIWAVDDPDKEMVKVVYHETDGEEFMSVNTMDTINLMQLPDEEQDGREYSFVGWSTDPNQAGYLRLDDSCNLYDFDDAKQLASIKPEVAEKFSLLGDCNPEKDNPINPAEYATDGELHLYPVYAVRAFANVATADSGIFKIVGIADYKDYEKTTSEEDDKREKWLGKIYVNVYRDGEIWVESEPMYFRYHNDDAADVNIKFIDDEILMGRSNTQDPLMDFMCDQTLYPAESQLGKYRIEAVYATQGGSEDGLKYKYNWISDNGGMLDNVAGGSTIDVYVSTCYQVKYYKNDELLTGAQWTDEGIYSTPGTENAFKQQAVNADYEVKIGNENAALMDGSIKDDSTFTDERLLRGEYSDFAYYIKERPHAFDVAALPEASAGKKLTGTTWQLKDADGKVLLTQDPNSVFTLTGTSYGTGNTIYSYLGDADREYTYHLYIYEEGAPTTENKKPSKPNTGDNSNLMQWGLLLGTAVVLLVILGVLKKKK